MAIPQLSTEQLESARAAATEARRARAQLKDQVKSGALTLPQALDRATGDEVLSRVKVVDLLRALPRVGVTRSQEIMESLDIAPPYPRPGSTSDRPVEGTLLLAGPADPLEFTSGWGGVARHRHDGSRCAIFLLRSL